MTRMKSVAIALFSLSLALSAHAAKRHLNGRIAWIDANNQLALMNADGSSPTEIQNAPQEFDAAFSPDGLKIVFSADGGNGFDLFLMNIDGSNVVQLTSSGSDRHPAFSPDGKTIAFESQRNGSSDIFVMRADGSAQTDISPGSTDDFEPSFAPNGSRILFVSNRTGRDELFTMNVDGTSPVQVTSLIDTKFNPKFSPDAGHIIYERFTAVFQRPEICTVNADGSNLTVVAKGQDGQIPLIHYATLFPPSNPTFSPDGTKIAYSITRSNQTFVYTNNPDGSSEVQLQSGVMADWQPLSPIDTAGVYRPSTGQWFLRTSNSGAALTGVVTFGGQPGDLPVTGDFNGDGRTDIGIYRNGTFLLATIKTTFPCFACPATLTAEQFATIPFGQPGDLPIAGDWDGDTIDDLGVFHPDDVGTFILRVKHLTFTQACPTCARVPVITFVAESHSFGTRGDLPVTGDWDNDRFDTYGVFHPATATFLFTNDLVEANLIIPTFGTTTDRPVSGDWLGHFGDSIGVFRPGSATWFLASHLGSSADISFTFGSSGDLPVSGHWGLIVF